MYEHEEENTHPADELLDVAVNSVMGAESPEDAINLLGQMAGGIQNAFINVASNTPDNAIRMVLYKLLSDAYASGDYQAVMDILDLSSIATLTVDPTTLDTARQDYRDHYDRDFGA